MKSKSIFVFIIFMVNIASPAIADEDSIFEGSRPINVTRLLEVSEDLIVAEASNQVNVVNIADNANISKNIDTWEPFKNYTGEEGSFVGAGLEENLMKVNDSGAVILSGLLRAPSNAIMSGASEGWLRIPLNLNVNETYKMCGLTHNEDYEVPSWIDWLNCSQNLDIRMQIYHIGNPEGYELNAEGYPQFCCKWSSDYHEGWSDMELFDSYYEHSIAPLAHPTKVWDQVYRFGAKDDKCSPRFSMPALPGSILSDLMPEEIANYYGNFNNEILPQCRSTLNNGIPLMGDQIRYDIDNRTYLWWSFPWYPDEHYAYIIETNNTMIFPEIYWTSSDLGEDGRYTSYLKLEDNMHHNLKTLWETNPAYTENCELHGYFHEPCNDDMTYNNITLPVDLGTSVLFTQGHGYGVRGFNITSSATVYTNLNYGINTGNPYPNYRAPLNGIMFYDKLSSPFNSSNERLTFTMPFSLPDVLVTNPEWGNTTTDFQEKAIVTTCVQGLDDSLRPISNESWTCNQQVASDHVIISGRDTDVNTTASVLNAQNTWGYGICYDHSEAFVPLVCDDYGDRLGKHGIWLDTGGGFEDSAIWTPNRAASAYNGDEFLHGATYLKYWMSFEFFDLPHVGGDMLTTNQYDVETNPTGPTDVDIGDMDGDGDMDLIVASSSLDRITWYENGGEEHPTWTPTVIEQVFSNHVSVFIADMDGDGDMDIVSGTETDDTVAWHENDGSPEPTFTSTALTILADGVRNVFAEDMDGDGDMDIIYASQEDSTIGWIENDDGNLDSYTHSDISVGSAFFAQDVHAADLDGDGDMDMVSASALDNTIAWYENDGAENPTWTAADIVTNATIALAVYAADMDGDGDIDILSASADDDTIAWYENDGAENPTWAAFDIRTDVDYAHDVKAADMDGDGYMDIISASMFDNSIDWYKNDGEANPTWTKTNIDNTLNGAKSVMFGDLDGDLDLDLAAAAYSDDRVIWSENARGMVRMTPQCQLSPERTLEPPFNSLHVHYNFACRGDGTRIWVYDHASEAMDEDSDLINSLWVFQGGNLSDDHSVWPSEEGYFNHEAFRQTTAVGSGIGTPAFTDSYLYANNISQYNNSINLRSYNWRPYHTTEITDGTLANLNPVQTGTTFEFHLTIIHDNKTYTDAEAWEIVPSIVKGIEGGDIMLDSFNFRGTGIPLQFTDEGLINQRFKDLYNFVDQTTKQCQSLDPTGNGVGGFCKPGMLNWQARELITLSDLFLVKTTLPSISEFVDFIVNRIEQNINAFMEAILFVIPFTVFVIGVAIIWHATRMLIYLIRGELDMAQELTSMDRYGLAGISKAFKNLDYARRRPKE